MERYSTISAQFERLFNAPPLVCQAPGRVNIIGDHTDYNGGFVLPAACEFRCWTAISRRADRKLVIHSSNIDDSCEASLDDLRPTRTWVDYPLGVAAQIQKSHYKLAGANLYIHGDVPLGAGLSSSAAIEVASAYALLETAGHSLPPATIALLCQRAENEFVGANCGIMDQFASCLSQANHALFLDCRSLQYELITIPDGICFAICNTMVKHQLVGGEYNVRRAECEQGVKLLSLLFPAIKSLRDATLPMLQAARGALTETIYRRCRHVISENARVEEMVAALQHSNLSAFHKLMAESHASLRDDFNVSTPELDLMVDLADKQTGVLGSRMMGGGFGGCTINLIKSQDVAAFKTYIYEHYSRETGQQPEIYISRPAHAAGRVLATSATVDL